MRILVVCTANQCRSPMVEALLRRHLEDRGVPAIVASVGLLPGGVPASAGAVRAMAERGLDIQEHRSTELTPEAVEGADLVLALARQHLREVALLSPDPLPKTFTLKELVRRASTESARGPEEPFDAWVRRLSSERRRRDLMGDDPADDVADPMGQPYDRYLATASELEDLIERFVRAAFPGASTS